MQDLAINGGPAVIPEGPPGWPPVDENVAAALQQLYTSGEWGRYESATYDQTTQQLSSLFDTEHVLLCSSGTIAVELALRGLNVGAGDEVIMAAYDFSANFRAIEVTGARPVLVDVLPENRTLNANQLQQAAGDSVKAILVSHLHGGMADMEQICEFATRNGWQVVEDACQVHGATVQGKPAGCWGDVGVTSFGGSKLVTAGRGGAVFTFSPQIFQRIKISNDRGNQAYPMSALQAAVIAPQLNLLATQHAKRRDAIEKLKAALTPVDCLQPVCNGDVACDPAYYKFAFRYDAARCGDTRRETFCAAVRAEGVALDAGFRGFAKRSSRRCRRAVETPHSVDAASTTVVLHHPLLLADDEMLDRAASAIRKVYNALRK